ncbi:MAG TPA: hypothetical protein VHA07_09645 [Devosia sp.]|nr:hypothetical protein [Devosia sp.]
MGRLIAISLTLLLAACSTLGVTTPFGGGATLDPVHDDIGSLLIAFDLPRGLGPAPSGQLFTFDVANGGPDEHLRLTLAQAEADQAMSALPPPAEGRAYYLFAVADKDRPALAAAQAAAAARGVAASGVKLGIVPHLCTSGTIDPNALTVSVFATIPGRTRLMPFLDQEPLAQLMTQPGSTQMPPCA